jgi:hypothetical protein
MSICITFDSDDETPIDETKINVNTVDILLIILNKKIITMKEYDHIKTLNKDYTLMTLKKSLEIIDKIKNSNFEDKYIFIDSIDDKILDFNIELLINNIIISVQFQLTDDQIMGVREMVNFMYDGGQLYLLQGFAGTGKTTLISILTEYLHSNGYLKAIAFSAPTNKAVNVLKSKFSQNKDSNYDFLTIHKLLQYKSDFDVSGNKVFVKKNNNSLFENYDLVVVDECSMLSKDIVSDIYPNNNNNKNNDNKKIILLGDPAQLPPVDEDISDIFNLDIKTITMKQVVRSNKDNVVNICNNVRKWMFKELPDPYMVKFKGKGVKFFKNDRNIKESKWLKHYLNNEGIILAWTNKKCDLYNNTIRQIKYNKKELNRFEIGDILILTEFYKSLDKAFYSSEQIKVINIKNDYKKFEGMSIEYPDYFDNIKNSIHIKKTVEKTLNNINIKTKRSYYIFILTINPLLNLNDEEPENINMYILDGLSINTNYAEKEFATEKINELIKFFQGYYKNEFKLIERIIIRKIWQSFNKTFVDQFANVNYGFSCTVHKSQASTFGNVYVDLDDILLNKKQLEGKRCLYTALTRASNQLNILV